MPSDNNCAKEKFTWLQWDDFRTVGKIQWGSIEATRDTSGGN